MTVGDQPQYSAGLEQGAGPADERLTQRTVLGPAVVEGRIADHEVEAVGRVHILKGRRAHIGPVQPGARKIGQVAPRRFHRTPVDIDQIEPGHGRGLQHREGHDAYAAAEVGARP